MSRWTVQVRRIIELAPDMDKMLSLDEKVRRIAQTNNIFKNYPIWDNSHRAELNYKILSHYLFREIGLETPELWKMRLNEKLNFIMPKYNLMAKAYTADFPLLQNINTVREYVINQTGIGSRDINNTTSGTSNTTGDNTTSGTSHNEGSITNNGSQNTTNNGTLTRNDNTDNKHADYPQSNITLGDYLSTEDVQTANSNQTKKDTAESTTEAKSSTSDDGTTSGTTKTKEDTTTAGSSNTDETSTNKQDTNYKEAYTGLQGYPVDFLLKYLEYVQDLDQLIIGDLADLFFLIL